MSFLNLKDTKQRTTQRLKVKAISFALSVAAVVGSGVWGDFTQAKAQSVGNLQEILAHEPSFILDSPHQFQQKDSNLLIAREHFEPNIGLKQNPIKSLFLTSIIVFYFGGIFHLFCYWMMTKCSIKSILSMLIPLLIIAVVFSFINLFLNELIYEIF